MSSHTGTSSLIEALRGRRRNGAALGFVAATVAAAALVGTKEAYYVAGLVVFSTWMLWFVLAGIEWVKLADF